MPNPNDAATLQAALEGVDLAARAAERKWGIDRLPTLVDDILRAKFRRQEARVTETMAKAWDCAGVVPKPVLDDAEAAAASMQRAWAALDAAATAAGHIPSEGRVLAELRLPDGSVAALVEDTAEASLVLAHRSYQAVYSLTEIENIIAALPDAITAAKREWPAGEIMRPRSSKPLNDPLHDLPAPFGDATDEVAAESARRAG
jgi:hypothetical protein